MNILIDLIPPRGRKYVYGLFALIGLVLGALDVADVNVAVALAVYAFIGTALGLTAYANTHPQPDVADGLDGVDPALFYEDAELDE